MKLPSGGGYDLPAGGVMSHPFNPPRTQVCPNSQSQKRLYSFVENSHLSSFIQTLDAFIACLSKVHNTRTLSRAAIYCAPRDISGGGSSFGTAASCTCRVVGFIICQMQGAGGGNYTIEQQEQRQPMRFIALHRAQ